MNKLVDKFRRRFRTSGGPDSEPKSAKNVYGSEPDLGNQIILPPLDRTSPCGPCQKIYQLVIHPHVFVQQGFPALQSSVFLSEYGLQSKTSDKTMFSTHETLEYEPFCDDFGPMNMSSIMRFIEILDNEILAAKGSPKTIVYCAGKGIRNLTNSAFLLGAYMILKLNQDPEAVLKCFESITFEGYRDATYSKPGFRLFLIDCWKGLFRGKCNGWVALPKRETPTMWGQINSVEYQRYESYLNGDLHTVVPNHFVAFKGPKDMNGQKYKDNYREGRFYSREFSPLYYCDIFEDIGVSTVIRLNDVCYQQRHFVENDIEHYDLFFEDCTTPPPSIVTEFFEIVDKAEGLVAIHCKAGLGRTGTLIALSLIRTHGFTAREAMGWLRIMRPGSVIGEQQAFLCAVEDCIKRNNARALAPEAPAALAAKPAAGGVKLAPLSRPPTPSAVNTPSPPPATVPHTAGPSTAATQIRGERLMARSFLIRGPLPGLGDALGGRDGAAAAAPKKAAAAAHFSSSLKGFRKEDLAASLEACPAELALQVSDGMDRRGARFAAAALRG